MCLGPALQALKAETIGLAAMLELPLVVIDVQRAGPSTGGGGRPAHPRRPPRGPSLAFALARLADRPTEPTPIGIFRAVERPLHGAAATLDADRAVADAAMLDALLHAGDTWTVA